MSAITRGRAILQENRTVVLGNSVAAKPFPKTTFAGKKPQIPLSVATTGMISKPITTTHFHPLSSRTQIIPNLSHIAVLERSYAEERKVYLSEDVDVKQIIIKPSIKTKTAKIIPMYYETEHKTLKLQTPAIRIPFGIAKTEKEAGEGTASGFSVNFAFDNMDKNPEMKRFFDLINAIDDRLLKEGETKSKDWFDKDVPIAVLQHTFKRAIKMPKEGNYAPIMKVKIPVDSSDPSKAPQPQINVFTSDKKPASYEDLTANSRVVAILELRYAWAASGTMVGCSYQLAQVKILDKAQRESHQLNGYSFIEKNNTEKN